MNDNIKNDKTLPQLPTKIEPIKDNFHHGHRERLKERFDESGFEGFSDHEVLELLLFFTIPRKDTNEIGHSLIDYFGSLSAVLEASKEDLIRISGIGENAARLIMMAAPMSKKYLDSKYSSGYIVDTIRKAGEFMSKKFIGATEEVVYAAALDNRRSVISCKAINYGTVNATEVNIRKIIEYSVRSNAVGIIIAHNHPNGYALPSEADILTTGKIEKALGLISIKLMDHIIVSGDDYVSFAESGLLSRNI